MIRRMYQRVYSGRGVFWRSELGYRQKMLTLLVVLVKLVLGDWNVRSRGITSVRGSWWHEWGHIVVVVVIHDNCQSSGLRMDADYANAVVSAKRCRNIDEERGKSCEVVVGELKSGPGADGNLR